MELEELQAKVSQLVSDISTVRPSDGRHERSRDSPGSRRDTRPRDGRDGRRRSRSRRRERDPRERERDRRDELRRPDRNDRNDRPERSDRYDRSDRSNRRSRERRGSWERRSRERGYRSDRSERRHDRHERRWGSLDRDRRRSRSRQRDDAAAAPAEPVDWSSAPETSAKAAGGPPPSEGWWTREDREEERGTASKASAPAPASSGFGDFGTSAGPSRRKPEREEVPEAEDIPGEIEQNFEEGLFRALHRRAVPGRSSQRLLWGPWRRSSAQATADLEKLQSAYCGVTKDDATSHLLSTAKQLHEGTPRQDRGCGELFRKSPGIRGLDVEAEPSPSSSGKMRYRCVCHLVEVVRGGQKRLEVTGCWQAARGKAEADGQAILEAFASEGMAGARQTQRRIMSGVWGQTGEASASEAASSGTPRLPKSKVASPAGGARSPPIRPIRPASKVKAPPALPVRTPVGAPPPKTANPQIKPAAKAVAAEEASPKALSARARPLNTASARGPKAQLESVLRGAMGEGRSVPPVSCVGRGAQRRELAPPPPVPPSAPLALLAPAVGLAWARRVAQATLRRCAEVDEMGIDDTGDDLQDSRQRFCTCVGSYAFRYEQEGLDWRVFAGRSERCSKSTVALIIGYLGHDYVGLQQPCFCGEKFVRAVETELELALLKAGAMIPENFGNLSRLRWSRVGRTDAGVSAACNVVTGRLTMKKARVLRLVSLELCRIL
ncbi:unnamed protein product [Effrenium voratum]|nr:unnamed protein product [Effrenium voratum]